MPTCTPGSTTTTHYGLCKPADGEVSWGTAFRTNMDAIDTAIFNASSGVPRSYLAGLGTTPTVASTSVSIAIGVAMGNDQATSITMSSAFVKVLSSTWAVGTGNGGLTSATSIQGNQTYHLFVILRTDTSAVDAYFDTSVSAANIPAPYTIYRRVASLKTATSTNMVNYVQDGDYFTLVTPSMDYNAAPASGTAQTVTLASIPTGSNMQAIINVMFTNSGGGAADFVYLSDLATTDLAPSLTILPLVTVSGIGATSALGQGPKTIRTNTSSQIRARLSSTGAGTLQIVTLGWYDRRGRDA